MIYSVIILLVLIILNGFFAGSEIAFLSLKEMKLRVLVNEGDQKAKRILKLKKNPNKFLSTIQIGVSLASILSGVFAAEAFARVLTDWALIFIALPASVIKTASMFLITLLTSYLMLVFGELVPKRLALAEPLKFAYLAVYPLSALASITTPIIKLLSLSTNFILKLLGINLEKTGERITEEEIRQMVEAGEIGRIEKEMIENIFEFDDLEVTKIMTHRSEVVAIESKETFDNILELVNKERFTRYPVFEGTIDNVIGIIHLRELLRFTKTGRKEDFNIHDLIKQPYFVPISKRADELFRELQKHQTHMGIVIGEYGETVGLVTMENLIEVIMGEISDEYDEEGKEIDILYLEEGNYLVDGFCTVELLEETLKIGLPIEEHTTVNGFVTSRLGRIPTKRDVKNEKSNFIFNGYLFSIEAMKKRVVSKVKVTKVTANKQE